MHADIFYNGADISTAYITYCEKHKPQGDDMVKLTRLACGWYRLDEGEREVLLSYLEPYVLQLVCRNLVESNPAMEKSLHQIGSILDDWFTIKEYHHRIARRAVLVAMQQVANSKSQCYAA